MADQNDSVTQNQAALRESLQKEIDQADWVWLARHSERDALILVTPSLDLVDVAVKVAADDATCVASWIQSGQVSKPTRQQLDAWNAQPTHKFLSLVVQPYVLIQEVGLKH